VEGTVVDGRPAAAVALEWQAADAPGLLAPGPRFLSIDLSEPFPDTPVLQDSLLSSQRRPGFLDLLRGLARAAADPSIRAVYLRVRDFPYGYGRAEELLSVLSRVVDARKRLVVYLETGAPLAYAVLSVSRELSLHPEVSLKLRGNGGAVTFLKGLFDRIGLQAQFWYVGRYKTAAEQLMLDGLTPAAREAEALLIRRRDDFLIEKIAWHRFAAKREPAAGLLLRGRIPAEQARAEGLVDRLQDEQETRSALGREGLAAIELDAYLQENSRPQDWGEKPLVAVVHIEGSIVRGKNSFSPLPFLGGKRAGDETIVEALSAVTGDPRVKAVVVRVQSGGGDVIASERIWRAVNRLRAGGRTVLVSMGDVAASGG
jgi:protease-4